MTAGKPAPWDRIESGRRDRAARAPGAPRDLGSCDGPNCSAKIRWATTVDGKRMPVDFAPDPGGNLIRVMVARGDWRIRVLAAGEAPPAGEPRWASHHSTCPDAARFRARGKKWEPRPADPGGHSNPVPVLLVVDGNSLAHRAYHAYERSAMSAPDGTPIWAVYGFLALLAGIVDRVRPDGVLVGFDDRHASSRRDRYPGYKAGRPEKSPDLHAQLEAIVAVLGELGVATAVPAGLEADDVLACGAAAAQAAGWRCTLATSDKDAFGLVTDSTTVLRLMSGLDNAQRITPAGLLDRYGVTPGQWPDYVALVGDASDNLPGVPGVGPKTAAKLLAACGTLEAALADPAGVVAAVGKAAASKLCAPGALEVVDRNRDLTAPVMTALVDLDACRLSVDAGTVAAVLSGRHLPTLVGRVSAALCPARPAPTDEAVPPVVVDPGPQGQAPRLCWQRPSPACPDCGRPVAAAVPLAVPGDGGVLVLAGEQVLVECEHQLGDLAPVRVGGVWVLRRTVPGEHSRIGDRRQSHRCPRYDRTCGCGQPARLYPGGAFCDRHARRSVWYCAPAGVKLIPVRCAAKPDAGTQSQHMM